MKSAGGAGLVIIGFLFLYLAITGRLDCFFTFVSCVTGIGNPTASNGSGGNGGGFNLGNAVNTGLNLWGQYQNGGNTGGSTGPQPISLFKHS